MPRSSFHESGAETHTSLNVHLSAGCGRVLPVELRQRISCLNGIENLNSDAIMSTRYLKSKLRRRIDDSNRYSDPTTLTIFQIICDELGVLFQRGFVSWSIHSSQNHFSEERNVLEP